MRCGLAVGPVYVVGPSSLKNVVASKGKAAPIVPVTAVEITLSPIHTHTSIFRGLLPNSNVAECWAL